MSFYRKYELERLVQKAEPKTFRAREVAGGRTVYLHLLGGMDASSRTTVLQKIRALVAVGSPDVLDFDDNEIAPYVVTGVLEDFTGLPSWLDRHGSSMPLPPPASTAPPVTAAPTQSTVRPAARRPEPAPPKPPPPPAQAATPPPTPAAPPPATPQSPGEFTVRFASADSFTPRSVPVASQMPPAAPQRAAPPPPLPATPASAMPSAQTPGEGPGEFTLMFAGSKGPAAPPPSPAAPPRAPAKPPTQPPSPPGAGVSQFTALYGPGPLSQPPLPPPQSMPQSAQEPGEFSRLFGAPPAAPADNPAGFAPAHAARQRPPDAPMPWEPQPPVSAAPPPPPPPAPPAAPARPVVETPDTQRVQAYVPPQTPAPVLPPPPPLPSGESASLWNSSPPSSPQQRPGEGGHEGEFTKFFASPLASGSLPIEDIEQGRMAEAMPPADKPFEGPGEFTRWFGKSGPGDKTPPPAPPAQHPTFSGRATGLFEQPNILDPGAPGEKKGPSEYTRIMAAQQGQLPGEPVAYVAGAAPGRGPLILIIVAIAVVLVVLVVLLFLTMRH